jgi:hypothetical protein
MKKHCSQELPADQVRISESFKKVEFLVLLKIQPSFFAYS